MSRFAKQLVATDTLERRLVPSMTVESTINFDLPYENRYVLKVCLGGFAWISKRDIEGTKGRIVNDALAAMRKKVVQEVFGEFREPINEIREMLYCRDLEGAMAGLERLEREMFESL
jgi:hypothetical protein